MLSILRLAFPALGVLLATPLYLLLDTAVIGHLGGVYLAALGAASVIQTVVTAQLTFLSYGTTSRAAHHYGAGNRPAAIYEGVQATWVALAVGILLSIIMLVGAPFFARLIADDPEVSALAAQWLRHACPVIPAALIVMAGNGWMRGVQDTRTPFIFTLCGVIPAAIAVPIFVRHYGFIGSAWANVLGESIIAFLFIIALIRSKSHIKIYGWKPQWSLIRIQLSLGLNLIARSLGMQIALLSAAAAAGRFGSASLGAHQVLGQIWSFLSLILDSIAIAAQSLVGAALGKKDMVEAKKISYRVISFSTILGIILALFMLLSSSMIPRIFTRDENILFAIEQSWLCLIIMLIIGGIVFALDGILLGAGDAKFLRNATLIAALCGYIPGAYMAVHFNWGLTGVWAGLIAFLLIRLIAGAWRFLSGKWALL